MYDSCYGGVCWRIAKSNTYRSLRNNYTTETSHPLSKVMKVLCLIPCAYFCAEGT